MEQLMTLMKLNLLMQADLYEKLGIECNAVDTGLIKEAIASGNLWALRRKIHGVCAEEKDHEVVAQVYDIMSMWQHIENSYKQLSQEGQARVTGEAARLVREPEFAGFAGNDEAQHLSVARFLIDQLGLYGLFKGRDLNCHCPSVAMQHLPMLIAYRRMRPTLTIGKPMSADQLIEVLTAKRFLAVERGRAA
jgi:uncharacterized protein YfbU (UPF0304 family)